MIYKNKTHTFIAWIAVIAWMVLIFYLSHQPAEASSELSRGITDAIIRFMKVTALYMKFDLDNLHFFIRKFAHFFAYLILGTLVINAVRINRKNSFKTIFFALIICILYAVSDEIHQLFIPGRSGEFRDVMIDSAGSIVGISLYLLITKTIKRITHLF